MSLPVRDKEATVRRAKERMVRRFAEQAKELGGLPHSRKIHAFVDDLFDDLTKQREEQRQKERLAPLRAVPAEDEREFAVGVERGRNLGSVTVGRPGSPLKVNPGMKRSRPLTWLEKIQKLPEHERMFELQLRQRLDELACIPEWRKRVLDAWYGPFDVDTATRQVVAVYHDSVRVFGPVTLGEPLGVLSAKTEDPKPGPPKKETHVLHGND